MTLTPRTPDHCIAEVLNLVGVHARALHALLGVTDIRWNDDVTTACIECRDRPTLHLNPTFVATWCRTPHRLATLILHEMLHITLGHTRLFPRPTPAHNLAFDAIINRLLLQSVVDAGADPAPYAALFTSYYAVDSAPAFLLRPPPGWPQHPDWSASSALPARLRTVHQRLYGGASDVPEMPDVTYADLLAALARSDSGACDGIPLLGAHGATVSEQQLLAGTRDADVVDALGGGVLRLGGTLPGVGGTLERLQLREANRVPAFERALRAWLRRGITAGDQATRRTRWQPRPVQVVHCHEDRRAFVRAHAAAAFGAPAPLLFAGTVLEPRPDPVQITLYVDVSGSMHDALPRIRRTLHAMWRELSPRLYWFSTRVVEAQSGDLAHGRIPTTGGTAICSVLEHVLDEARTSRPTGPVFVLTDGHVEVVPHAIAHAVHAQGLRIHLGVIGSGPLHTTARWVAGASRLPDL